MLLTPERMHELFIPVLLGTARKERESKAVADFVVRLLSEQVGVETACVDVASMGFAATVPPWGKGGADEEGTSWKETMTRADGLVIVVPEYNRGYPGELKLALDSLYTEYEKKPVALCGVSSGNFGGSRVVEHIKPVLVELGMVPVRKAFLVPKVGSAFTDTGQPADESLAERAQPMLDELLWYARVLKQGRNQ